MTPTEKMIEDGLWKPKKARVRHMARAIREDGAVSPLCAKTPRAINMKKESWVLRLEAVTCQKCIDAIARGETQQQEPL